MAARAATVIYGGFRGRWTAGGIASLVGMAMLVGATVAGGQEMCKTSWEIRFGELQKHSKPYMATVMYRRRVRIIGNLESGSQISGGFGRLKSFRKPKSRYSMQSAFDGKSVALTSDADAAVGMKCSNV